MGKKNKRRMAAPYDGLRLYFDGIIVVCIIVTAIGSAIAKATIPIVLFRSVYVCVLLLILSRILIKVWIAWETMKKNHSDVGAGND